MEDINAFSGAKFDLHCVSNNIVGCTYLRFGQLKPGNFYTDGSYEFYYQSCLDGKFYVKGTGDPGWKEVEDINLIDYKYLEILHSKEYAAILKKEAEEVEDEGYF